MLITLNILFGKISLGGFVGCVTLLGFKISVLTSLGGKFLFIYL